MDPLMYNLSSIRIVPPTWSDIFKNIHYVNDSKKAEWEACIKFLKQELGNTFFNNCGSEHPINLKLTTNLHLCEDLIDFTIALQHLKSRDSQSYNILLQKLKPRLKCQTEGIPFTDVLRTFSKGGFDVGILEPVSSGKSPDMLLTDPETLDCIYVEVSQLTISKKQSDIQSQHRKIVNAFMFNGVFLPCTFKQLQPLDEKGINRIIHQVHTIKESAVFQEKFVCYEDDFIIMAIAHPSKLEQLESWCNLKGLQVNGLTGLSQDFNDTYRLVDNHKIAKEIKQLPVGKPGVVYLSVSVLYFFMMDFKETILDIVEVLENFPDCLGVILFAESSGSLLQERNISIGNTKLVVNKLNSLDRHLLYVHNLNFSGMITGSTFSRFIQNLR